MDVDVENVDVSGGPSFINSHTLSEGKNQNSVDYTKKCMEMFQCIEMEYTVLQDGVDIDDILSEFKLRQYYNMEFNN